MKYKSPPDDFKPDGYASFRETVVLVTENPSSGNFVGGLTDEQKTILQNYETESEKAKRSPRTKIVNGRYTNSVPFPVETTEILEAQTKLRNIQTQVCEAGNTIRNWCFFGSLDGCILNKEGERIPIPTNVWGGDAFNDIESRGVATFRTGSPWPTAHSGRVLFLTSDIMRLIGQGVPDAGPDDATADTLPDVPAPDEDDGQNGGAKTASRIKQLRGGDPPPKVTSNIERKHKGRGGPKRRNYLTALTICLNFLYDSRRGDMLDMPLVEIRTLVGKYFEHPDRRDVRALLPKSRSTLEPHIKKFLEDKRQEGI